MSRFSPTESLSVTIILSNTVVPIGASSKTSTSYGTCERTENGRGSKVELLIKSSRDWTNCAYILKFGRIIIIVQDNDSDWHLDDIVVLRVPRRVHSVLNGHQELKRVLALQQKKKREDGGNEESASAIIFPLGIGWFIRISSLLS